MRDAFAVQPDDDLDLPAVVRRKAPARPAHKRPRKAGIAERLAAYVLSRPRQILAAIFLTGCAGVIAWNALVLQSAQHPAPLFNHRDDGAGPMPVLANRLPPARPAPAAYEAPPLMPAQPLVVPQAPAPAPPVAKPPPRGAIAEMIRNGGEAPATASPKPVQQQSAAQVPPPAKASVVTRDQIGEMIRMGGPVPTPPANVGRPDAGDLVTAGQRALAKLGYGVKADGVMGAGTRQAIERFEQDRRLPVTGEFGPRTIRELSALSGMAVQ